MGNRNRLGRPFVIVVLLAAIAALVSSSPAPAAAPPRGIDDLRINQIQVVGSHNSYHLAASAEETAIRRSFIGDADNGMQYTHARLPVQFETQKVRQIELDVFRDDEGGKYSDPLLRAVAGHGPYDPAMDEPGTKVLHVQDVDYRTTCLSLADCLTAIESWSDANPTHMPIAILMELKDSLLEIGDFPFVVPDPWNASAMNALDTEIRSVMSADDMITPDDVRGDSDTLEEAVTTNGWPTLEDSRGKVMFLMDNGGGYRTDYLSGGHTTLEGRVMFTNSSPGNDDAGFVKMNEPRGNEEEIADLVETGYVVRTRSDADTQEARTGDTTGREAAFASGAQWVSTDYPVEAYAEPFGTGYVVEIPGGTVARCNPVNAPGSCVAADIDTLLPPEEGPYVDLLYEKLLGRPADAAGRDHFAAQLESGFPREVVARWLGLSAEGRRFSVKQVYQAYLGRPADSVALNVWPWPPLDTMRVGVLTSAELYAKSGGTDAEWITRLYELILHRAPDSGGLAYFVARLASDDGTRKSVAWEMLRSAEAKRVLVDDVVETILGRAATAADHAAAAPILDAGGDARSLAFFFIATDEAHDSVVS